jgi:uncharacterized membrane protein YqhA
MPEEKQRDAPPVGSGQPPAQDPWLLRLFAASRFFAAFAVFGSFLAAITLYVYGALVVVLQIWHTLRHDHVSVPGIQRLQAAFIEMTDVFLLGTVLFIVSFGLYQLFINPNVPVPAWLKIESLDELSERLIEVVGVLLAVTFLGFAVNLVSSVLEVLEELQNAENTEAIDETTALLTDQVSLLELGVSVAIVIAALSLLLTVSRRNAGSREGSHES